MVVIPVWFGDVIGMGFPEPGDDDRGDKPGNPGGQPAQRPDAVIRHQILNDTHDTGNQYQWHDPATHGAKTTIEPQNRRPAGKARQAKQNGGIMRQFGTGNAGHADQGLERGCHIAKQHRPAMADHRGGNGDDGREPHAEQKRCDDRNRHTEPGNALQEGGKHITKDQQLQRAIIG